MSKELEAYKELKSFILDTQCGTSNSEAMRFTDSFAYLEQNVFPIVESALKRNIELEEENKILTIIRDNFNLYIEPEYRATLQLLQCCSMTQGEYKKFIEYFGEPRE